jgi:hypothetical protein
MGDIVRLGSQSSILVCRHDGKALLRTRLYASGVSTAKITDAEGLAAVTAHPDNIRTVFGAGVETGPTANAFRFVQQYCTRKGIARQGDHVFWTGSQAGCIIATGAQGRNIKGWFEMMYENAAATGIKCFFVEQGAFSFANLASGASGVINGNITWSGDTCGAVCMKN